MCFHWCGRREKTTGDQGYAEKGQVVHQHRISYTTTLPPQTPHIPLLPHLLHIKPCPLLLHPPLPLPLLPTPPLHPAIHPPEFQRKPRPNLLHTHLNILHTPHRLPIIPQDGLLRLALVAEDVPVAPHEDVVALIVQREDLAPLEFGGGREQVFEKVGG